MRVPVSARPVWLVLAATASVQLGAAFAKGLFDVASPTAVVWLRLALSTLVLLAVVRPALRGRSAADVGVVLAFGTSLAVMNWSIYQSFARLPLGVAVSIELLGPLVLALVLSRRALDVGWVVLAAAGVGLLGLRGDGVTLAGVGFALVAAAAWAAYIPLSAATGRRWEGLSGLAVAGVVGSVGLAPAAAATGGLSWSAGLLGTALVVALLSSVVPYSLELMALRTMPPRLFGVLMSLDPVAAALAGLAVLGETLTAVEWAGVACVVVASTGMTRSTSVPPGSAHAV